MPNKTFSIKYPDTLVEMWKYVHTPQETSISDDEFSNSYEQLANIIAGTLSKKQNNKNFEENKSHAMDFLCFLFQGVCPSHIVLQSFLTNNAKRFIIHENEPAEYERSQILYEALRFLEKAGEIKRDKNSIGKNISNKTFFVLTSLKSPTRASYSDYEQNSDKVPFYHTKIRGGKLEKTKMLAPAQAKELCIQLLQAFGGWTQSSDLLKAMKNHMVDQLKTMSLEIPDKETGKTFDIEDLQEDNSDSYIYHFDCKQILLLSATTTERIWEKVCKVSDRVFCLYFLPDMYNKKPSMATLGNTSTIFDQNTKIKKIMEAELADYRDLSGFGERELSLIKSAIHKILQNLNGRCTEKGYNTNLLTEEIN